MMKWKKYIAVSLLLAASSQPVVACGPWNRTSEDVMFYRIMPMDEYDANSYEFGSYQRLALADSVQRNTIPANVKLWQAQTSKDIPADEIRNLVYDTRLNALERLAAVAATGRGTAGNAFARWIIENRRADIANLLLVAKRVELIRAELNDPWFYPVEGDDRFRQLDDLLAECQAYTNGPLLGRYALQVARILCTLHRYADCVAYWREVAPRLPNDVVRDMFEGKAAAALKRTGHAEEADAIYARLGDYESILFGSERSRSASAMLAYVYDRCPNSPLLDSWIQQTFIYTSEKYYTPDYDLVRLGQRVVREHKVKDMAKWHYALAVWQDEAGQSRQALRTLEQGERYPRTPFQRDAYRLLRMWLDARTATQPDAYEHRLYRDLRWLDQKITRNITPQVRRHVEGAHNYHQRVNFYYWNDALRRILLRGAVPRLHELGHDVRAIQLANMAENRLFQLVTTSRHDSLWAWQWKKDSWGGEYVFAGLFNKHDYSNEMFQLVDTLSFATAQRYYTRMNHPRSSFDRFLNARSYTELAYWNDILGTKLLRERRYVEAVRYLERVPLDFQKQMNIYPNMHRNPFNYDMWEFKDEQQLAPNYKLNFARRMATLHRTLNHNADPNRRAEAQIEYALGLRNSVVRCWPLTRYSNGYIYNDDSEWNSSYGNYFHGPGAFCTSSAHPAFCQAASLRRSAQLIEKALAKYTDPERAAQQLRLLSRRREVLDRYGNTSVAADIRARCDLWRDYQPRRRKS